MYIPADDGMAPNLIIANKLGHMLSNVHQIMWVVVKIMVPFWAPEILGAGVIIGIRVSSTANLWFGYVHCAVPARGFRTMV